MKIAPGPLHFNPALTGKPGQQVCNGSHFGCIKITRCAHSVSACSRHLCMGVVLHAHLVHGESHRFNTTLTERLQHLQKVWDRLVEMTESERDKQNAN